MVFEKGWLGKVYITMYLFKIGGLGQCFQTLFMFMSPC